LGKQPAVWIFKPTLENFKIIFIDRGQGQNLIHSIIVAAGAVLIALLLGLPAAYGLARFKFKGSSQLLSWLIIPAYDPTDCGTPAIYIIFSRLRWLTLILA